MQAAEIVNRITNAGGRIWLKGDKVRARLPECLRPLVSVIRVHKAELVEELARRVPDEQPQTVDGDFDSLDDLRRPLVDWFDADIRLDVEWLALHASYPRLRSGVDSLHAAFCRWMFARYEVPPLRAEFEHLLEELCCDIRNVGGEQLVLGVALKEDVVAVGPRKGGPR